MSRIDEALRRKQEQQDATTASEPAAAATATPEAEDPWHVSDTLAPAPAPEARRSPAFEAPSGTTGTFIGAPQTAPQIYEKLVVNTTSLPSGVVEQYRRLAATLHHAQVDRGVRSVMITSALAGEGKSLTATNLALTLSESYKRRVLLIDADLRRPSLNKVFQVPETSGLADGLGIDAERRLPVIQLSPYLTLLPAGRPTPDPMASLTSGRMKHIVAEAREAFDWVILDTPPIALLTDAALLAAMVDTAVLVVRAARTPLAAARRAAEAVGRERLIGVVLNGVEDRPHASYDYYYSTYGADA